MSVSGVVGRGESEWVELAGVGDREENALESFAIISHYARSIELSARVFKNLLFQPSSKIMKHEEEKILFT